jgi:hypothetical protein
MLRIRFLASAILLACAAPIAAQTFPAEFSSIGAVRELSDGRTLVTDWREKRLVVLDWGAGSTRDIGRVGDGPGEYQSLSQLVALPADSTILIDGSSRRWTLYVGDRLHSTLPPEVVLHLSQFSSPALGADGRGHVLLNAAVPSQGQGERAELSRMPSYAESLLVLRASRGSTRIDTLAGIRGRPWGVTKISYGTSSRRMMYAANNPLSAPEQALLLPDGSVAIARQDPFRVQWITPGGLRRLGPVLDSTTARVTARDRAAAITRAWPNPMTPPLAETDFAGWPERMPAFPVEALLHVPSNRLAIRRQVSVAAPNERVDVVASDGRLVKRIQLLPGERAVAFGARHIYVTRTDEDGFVILSRREW